MIKCGRSLELDDKERRVEWTMKEITGVERGSLDECRSRTGGFGESSTVLSGQKLIFRNELDQEIARNRMGTDSLHVFNCYPGSLTDCTQL